MKPLACTIAAGAFTCHKHCLSVRSNYAQRCKGPKMFFFLSNSQVTGLFNVDTARAGCVCSQQHQPFERNHVLSHPCTQRPDVFFWEL